MQKRSSAKHLAGWVMIATVAYVALWLSIVPGWISDLASVESWARMGIFTVLISAGMVIPVYLATIAIRLWQAEGTVR